MKNIMRIPMPGSQAGLPTWAPDFALGTVVPDPWDGADAGFVYAHHDVPLLPPEELERQLLFAEIALAEYAVFGDPTARWWTGNRRWRLATPLGVSVPKHVGLGYTVTLTSTESRCGR